MWIGTYCKGVGFFSINRLCNAKGKFERFAFRACLIFGRMMTNVTIITIRFSIRLDLLRRE